MDTSHVESSWLTYSGSSRRRADAEQTQDMKLTTSVLPFSHTPPSFASKIDTKDNVGVGAKMSNSPESEKATWLPPLPPSVGATRMKYRPPAGVVAALAVHATVPSFVVSVATVCTKVKQLVSTSTMQPLACHTSIFTLEEKRNKGEKERGYRGYMY